MPTVNLNDLSFPSVGPLSGEVNVPFSSAGRNEVAIPYGFAGNGETVLYQYRPRPAELNLSNNQNKSELSFYTVPQVREELFIGGTQNRSPIEPPPFHIPPIPPIPSPVPIPPGGGGNNSGPGGGNVPPIGMPPPGSPPPDLYEVGCPGTEKPLVIQHPRPVDCINYVIPEERVFSGVRYRVKK